MSKNLLIPSCLAAMVLSGAFAGLCAFEYTRSVSADRYYTEQANALQNSSLNAITLSMRAASDASYIGQLQQVSAAVDSSISGLRRGSASTGIPQLPPLAAGNLDKFETSWGKVLSSIQKIAASRGNNVAFERQSAEATQLASSLLTESAGAINGIEASPQANVQIKQALDKAKADLAEGIDVLTTSSAPNSDSLNLALEASKAYVNTLGTMGSSMRLDKTLIDPLLKSYRTAQALNRSAVKAIEASSGAVENGPQARAIWAERENLEAAINGLQHSINSMSKSRFVSPMIMVGSVGLTLLIVLFGITLILREARSRTRHAETLGSTIQTSQKERSQELRQLFDEMEAVGNGDLTVEFQTGLGSTHEIANTLNQVFTQVRSIVKDVQQTIASLSAASEETLSMAKNVNRNRKEQDAAIQHITGLVDELRSFTKQLDDLSSRTREASKEVSTEINAGTNSVQEVHEGVVKLAQSNMNIMHHTKAMTENIQSLERLVDVVRRVANQSANVGFNVYLAAEQTPDDELSKRIRVSADAITSLTQSAVEASEQIATSLRGINDAAKETQYVLDDSQNDIKTLTSKSSHAMKAMSTIRDQTIQLTDRIMTVAGQTSDLNHRSEQVAETMGTIHHYASDHSAASEQTAVAISNLNTQAQRVGDTLSHFRV
jgi:methyl-accepting chemotaxis protein